VPADREERHRLDPETIGDEEERGRDREGGERERDQMDPGMAAPEPPAGGAGQSVREPEQCERHQDRRAEERQASEGGHVPLELGDMQDLRNLGPGPHERHLAQEEPAGAAGSSRQKCHASSPQ
jgi:hypothetical protein